MGLADFFRGQLTDHSGRAPDNEGSFGIFLPLGNQGASRHDAIPADAGPVHDDRPHTHKDIILYGTGVKDGIMAHSHLVSYMDANSRGKMDGGIVLDVGPLANDNIGQVPTKYRIIEYGGILSDGHVPDDTGTLRQKDALRNLGLLALVYDNASHIPNVQ